MDTQFDQFNSEDEIKILKKKVQIRDALKRLTNNPDWDLVINHEFKETFVSEIMQAFASGLIKDESSRERHFAFAQAPGFLMQFCDLVMADGDNAEQALNEHNSPLQ